MTISSLWTVLDASGCGAPVGLRDLLVTTEYVHNNSSGSSNTTTTHPKPKTTTTTTADRPKSLALDLSAWICEALTSTALRTFHSDPVLHLVYHRTVLLLKIGLGLVAVIEGGEGKTENRNKRMGHNNSSSFSSWDPENHSREIGQSSRRSRPPKAFWDACRRCERLFHLLGVPTLRAEAEGEALCALLNSRGIVDGVISNDGDCFAFGATVVFVNVSIENLEKSKVMRYDLDCLRAMVIDENEKDEDEGIGIPTKRRSIVLQRNDLIAFALLTGSDAVGGGLSHVGHKKAIKFIDVCRRLYPLSKETSALDELKSWGNAATATTTLDNSLAGKSGTSCIGERKKRGTCCSVCLHAGNKRDHMINGCVDCGTEAGEMCFAVSSDDKFRRALRAKAMTAKAPFDPYEAIRVYRKPNRGEIPCSIFSWCDGTCLRMKVPQFNEIYKSGFLVKGRSTEATRECLDQTLTKLLARVNIIRPQNRPTNTYKKKSEPGDEMPVPLKIVKRSTHEMHMCYEVSWSLGGKEFATLEWQHLVNGRYSSLVKQFEAEERREIQDAAENHRRRMFLGDGRTNQADDRKHSKTRKQSRNWIVDNGARGERTRKSIKKARTFCSRNSQLIHADRNCGDDVARLMKFVPGSVDNQRGEHINLKGSDVDSFPADEDVVSINSSNWGSALLSPTQTPRKASQEQSLLKQTQTTYPSSPVTKEGDILERQQSWIKDDDCPAAHDLVHTPAKPSMEPNARNNNLSQNHNPFPSLTSSNENVITCDMGIEIVMTPITSRRRGCLILTA